MEDNSLDVLGLQLVDYFIKYENYEPLNISTLDEYEKGTVYLLNKKSSKFQIIKIVKQNNFSSTILNKKDNTVENIKANNFDANVKPKELLIILNNDNQNETNHSPTIDIIISTPEKILSELKNFFPMIDKKIINENINDAEHDNSSENNAENLSSSEKKWKDINFKNRKFLKESMSKIKNNQLVYTWILLVFPIAGFIFTLIVYSNIEHLSQFLFSSEDIKRLVFGASHHNLVYGGFQFWRWITYPLVFNNLPEFLISLFFFSSIAKYVESFYGGKKALIIWISSTILVGFFQSAIQQNDIMSGFLPLTYISMGAMIPIIWNYKLFKSPISSNLYILSIIFVIAWMTTGLSISLAIQFFISLAVGWCLGSIVSYHNRKLSYFYVFSPIIIAVLLLFSILIIVINRYYNVDYNGKTNNVLLVYKQLGIVSESYINWVNKNFFRK